MNEQLTDADLVARFRELAIKIDAFISLLQRCDHETLAGRNIAHVAGLTMSLVIKDLEGDWWKKPTTATPRPRTIYESLATMKGGVN